MSQESIPISASRFALALKDLPLSTIHLKVLELRNSIAHLDYSNEQLRPFVDATEPSANGVPDAVCVEAVRENEVVIRRQQERIALLKAEVEGRGANWTEFQSEEEVKEGLKGDVDEVMANGVEGGNARSEERSSAWTDGTFQTGRIVNGEVQMDGEAQMSGATNVTASNAGGGRLDDASLRQAMEERMRALTEEGDDDGGMHL